MYFIISVIFYNDRVIAMVASGRGKIIMIFGLHIKTATHLRVTTHRLGTSILKDDALRARL
jgi:hypothetical protein